MNNKPSSPQETIVNKPLTAPQLQEQIQNLSKEIKQLRLYISDTIFKKIERLKLEIIEQETKLSTLEKTQNTGMTEIKSQLDKNKKALHFDQKWWGEKQAKLDEKEAELRKLQAPIEVEAIHTALETAPALALEQLAPQADKQTTIVKVPEPQQASINDNYIDAQVNQPSQQESTQAQQKPIQDLVIAQSTPASIGTIDAKNIGIKNEKIISLENEIQRTQALLKKQQNEYAKAVTKITNLKAPATETELQNAKITQESAAKIITSTQAKITLLQANLEEQNQSQIEALTLKKSKSQAQEPEKSALQEAAIAQDLSSLLNLQTVKEHSRLLTVPIEQQIAELTEQITPILKTKQISELQANEVIKQITEAYPEAQLILEKIEKLPKNTKNQKAIYKVIVDQIVSPEAQTHIPALQHKQHAHANATLERENTLTLKTIRQGTTILDAITQQEANILDTTIQKGTLPNKQTIIQGQFTAKVMNVLPTKQTAKTIVQCIGLLTITPIIIAICSIIQVTCILQNKSKPETQSHSDIQLANHIASSNKNQSMLSGLMECVSQLFSRENKDTQIKR